MYHFSEWSGDREPIWDASVSGMEDVSHPASAGKCHNKGTSVVLLPGKRSVTPKKLKIYRYAGGYYE